MIRKPQGFSLVETLIAIFIVSVVTLGASSLLIQTHRTSNKSKVVMQGLQLEADLIEAVANKNSGWSAFSENLRQGNTPLLELKRMMAPGTAEDAILEIPPSGQALRPIYYDRNWRKVEADDKWTVRILLSYRKTFDPPGDQLPQYAIAYSIEFNTSGALPGMGAVRDLGQIASSGQFAQDDYILPISTFAYSGDNEGDRYRPGQCSADPKEVIGVTEINFLAQNAKCVIASSDLTCSEEQISVGTTLAESQGNFIFGLNCKDKMKCSCKMIAPRNWVITSFAPNSMIYETDVCGTCEFAYKNNVPGIGVGISGVETVAANVCPRSEFYNVRATCSATPQLSLRTDLTPAQVTACQANPPSDMPQNETVLGIPGASGTGSATCSLQGGSNACYTWVYQLEFTADSLCVLDTELVGAQNATQIR